MDVELGGRCGPIDDDIREMVEYTGEALRIEHEGMRGLGEEGGNRRSGERQRLISNVASPR